MKAMAQSNLLTKQAGRVPLPQVLRRFWIAIVALTAVAWGIIFL